MTMKKVFVITTLLCLICTSVFAYVGNKRTYKFHHDHCSSVGQMADDHNKVYIESKEEAIARGYVPCKRCRP